MRRPRQLVITNATIFDDHGVWATSTACVMHRAPHLATRVQMLAAPSADEADEEEAAASGRLRVAGRRDAWEELQLRQIAELASQIRSVEAKVTVLENEVRNPGSGSAAEDGCLLEQLQLRTLQQQIQPGPII